jgi:O-methyltransferase
LTGIADEVEYRPLQPSPDDRMRFLHKPLASVLDRLGLRLMRWAPIDRERRAEGMDWPLSATTMVGLRRLDNLQACIERLVAEDVPGDLIETGVWRGGASIFMRGALEAYGDRERTVWVADSFQGLPKPDAQMYPRDEGDPLWRSRELAVPVEEVQRNFERFGLLDDRVRFLAGWFRDTLPNAPVERLSLIRLDGDMYESTAVALESLYPKLSPGGFVIVDDYGVPGARAATDDFRGERGIEEPLERIDWVGAFWRKSN